MIEEIYIKGILQLITVLFGTSAWQYIKFRYEKKKDFIICIVNYYNKLFEEAKHTYLIFSEDRTPNVEVKEENKKYAEKVYDDKSQVSFMVYTKLWDNKKINEIKLKLDNCRDQLLVELSTDEHKLTSGKDMVELKNIISDRLSPHFDKIIYELRPWYKKLRRESK